MVLPLLPLLFLAGLVGGGAGLLWYDSLTQAEKDEANLLTSETARRMFQTDVANLTSAQAEIVHRLVKSRYV